MPAMDLIFYWIVMRKQHLILYVVAESLIFFSVPLGYIHNDTVLFTHLIIFRRETCLLSKSPFLMDFCAAINVGFPPAATGTLMKIQAYVACVYLG